MLKKLFGSVFGDAPKAPTYTVPTELPSLNPDLNTVLPRIKLPDVIKRHMKDPSVEIDAPTEWVAPAVEDVATDVAKEAVVDTVTEEAPSEVGELLAEAVEQADGDSVPFLTSLLKDPRFALISVKFLAFGLKKETAILWAAESATLGYAIAGQKDDTGAVQMSPEEEMAVQQAEAYAAGEEISPDTISNLVSEAGMDKPGALAAQAASWDQAPPPPEAGDPNVLVGDMVAGAVLLAAAMTLTKPDPKDDLEQPELSIEQQDMPLEEMPVVPDEPKEITPMAAALKPFMEKGLELAAMS